MRVNKPGNPGVYSCDHCGQRTSGGVYTGHPAYEHLCKPCKGAGLVGSAAQKGTFGTPVRVRKARAPITPEMRAKMQAAKNQKLAKARESVV
jgi:hypothetical protein